MENIKDFVNAPFDFSRLQLFSKYRRCVHFSDSDISILDNSRVFSLFNGQCSGFFEHENGLVSALCVFELLERESHFFGHKMAVMHCYASAQKKTGAVISLIQKTLNHAFLCEGFEHISVDVDADNYFMANCFFSCGFELLDIKRVQSFNRVNANSAYSKFQNNVRAYTQEDYSQVMALLDKTHFETKLTRDTYLPAGRAHDFYRAWFSRLLLGESAAAHKLVFERGGEVLACGVIDEIDFSSHGLNKKIMAGGLYACAPSAVGAYAPVLYRLCQNSIASHGAAETTVSLNNAAAIRVLEGIRPNHAVTVMALRAIKPC